MLLKHAFPPIVAPSARLIVLGSLPGDRSLAAGRYYAHPQNQFWRLMSPVVGRDLVALDHDARLAELVATGIALWDVIGAARRDGSGDAAIVDAQANDIAGFVATLPLLRAVAFNGRTALKHGQASLGSRFADIARVALPSSSPLHTVGLAAKQPAWDRLRDYLV